MAHKKVNERTGKFLRFLNRKGLAIAPHLLRFETLAVCLYSYVSHALHLQHPVRTGPTAKYGIIRDQPVGRFPCRLKGSHVTLYSAAQPIIPLLLPDRWKENRISCSWYTPYKAYASTSPSRFLWIRAFWKRPGKTSKPQFERDETFWCGVWHVSQQIYLCPDVDSLRIRQRI